MNCFVDRDMFMRLRGGGVGHLGTRSRDSRLKGDSHEPSDEQRDEATFAVMHEESDSYLDDERGDRVEEDSGVHEERTGRREDIDEEDQEDEDEDN